MRKSRSERALLKWVEPRIFGIFALVSLFIFAVLFISVGFGENYFSRQICFGEGCWEIFARLFSLPIAVLVNAAKLVVAYSASVGILVAVNNYIQVERTASFQEQLVRRTAFDGYVAGKLAPLTHLDSNIVSISTWYAAIHPNSDEGDLDVSGSYIDYIEDIQEFVRRTDAFIIKVGRGYRHDRYHGPVIEKLSRIGIFLKGTSRLDFFAFEREAYALINSVNDTFCAGYRCAHLVPSKAHEIP